MSVISSIGASVLFSWKLNVKPLIRVAFLFVHLKFP
jgi:hypothetical protein